MDTLTTRTLAEWSLRAGWRLHQDATDVVRTALCGDAALGRQTVRLLLTTMEESAAGAAMLATDDSTRSVWTEFHNKVEAFRAFEHVDALLGVPVNGGRVTELLHRAGALPPPLSVWAAEGIGYHATAIDCRRRGWDQQPWARRDVAPDWAQIPFHAGMGSALAMDTLERAVTNPTPGAIASAVARVEELCLVLSADGWHDVALEALGFTLQGLFGELAADVIRWVRTAKPSLAGLVGHGVGRALYFSPTSALPLAHTRRRVLDELFTCRRPADERANMIAGFAWAATLVNLRDPFVLEPYAEDAVRLGVEGEFARGIHDALAVWLSCAPGDPKTVAFLTHLPRSAVSQDCWRRLLDAAPARHVRHPACLFKTSSGLT